MKVPYAAAIAFFVTPPCLAFRPSLPTNTRSFHAKRSKTFSNQPPDYITSKGSRDSKHSSSSLHRRRRRKRPPRVPVPRFAALANFTSSVSIEEWIKKSISSSSTSSSPEGKQLKEAFEQWSSQEQARFIHELASHGESTAVVLFVQQYGKRNAFVFHAALSALADLKSWEELQIIFELMIENNNEIRPSSFTLGTMFRSAQSVHNIRQLRKRLLEIAPEQVHWTAEVFESAIRGCIRDSGKDQEQTWELMQEIRQWMHEAGVTPSTRIFRAILEVCSYMDYISSEKVSSLVNETLQAADENPETVTLDDRLWGIILQAFAAARDDTQALRILRTMNDKGFVPNARHCSTFIKTLSLTKQAALAVQFLNRMANLHCSAEEFVGLDLSTPDQMSVVAVISACAVSDEYELAYEVLQKMKMQEYGSEAPPNERAYNVLLSSCREPAQAYALVREMRLTRRYRTGVIPPSLITYSKAIAVCRRVGDLDMALTLFELAKDDGLQPDVYVYSAVIWTAAEASDSECATRMMQEMIDCSIRPTIVSYNGMLSAYAATGAFDAMIAAFEEIQSTTSATRATFNVFSRAAKSFKDATDKINFLEKVYNLMKARDRHVEVGGQLIESLVFAYGSLGLFEEALQTFESLQGPSDAPNLRAILFACSNSNPPAWEIALELLHTSDIFFGTHPPTHVDSVALAYAMLACSKADRWEESLNLLQLYGSADTSVVAFNSLIAACGRCSRPDVAIEVLNEMENHGISPDVLSFRNAIIACNQAEHARVRMERENDAPSGLAPSRRKQIVFEWWECALSLVRRMKESGLTPDVQTYSSVISACEAAGQWQRALGLLQSMNENDKNVYCYNAAISACEKGGAWVEAVELYERMKLRGMNPNSVSVSSVAQALDRAGQKEMAQAIYQEAIQSGILKPWKKSRDFTGKIIRVLDLHRFSAALARAAVRSQMESMLDSPPDKVEDLVIVVGRGIHSTADPVLKESISSVLKEEYGVDSAGAFDVANPGRLILCKQTLEQLIQSRQAFFDG